MARERTRELINIDCPATDTTPGYSYIEEIREIPIPGFGDSLRRSIFILSFYDDEDSAEDFEFLSLRSLKKKVTELTKTWQLKHGIAVAITSTSAKPTQELVQRKLVKAHAGMLRTLAQASEAGVTGKTYKRIEKVVENLGGALDQIEELTGITNESVVEAIELHKVKLKEARKAKQNESD